MKPKTLLQGALTALLFLSAAPLWSQQMNYQGRLTDVNGNPLADGQQILTFSLWDAASGGNQIWGPYLADGTSTAGHGPFAMIVNGRFNTLLGPTDTASRPLNTAFNGDRWLQIQVAGNSPITPRQKLLPAPIAMKADIATTVVDNAINTAQIADGAITAAKLNSATGVWLTNTAGTFRTAGSVGLGNSLPLNPASPSVATPGVRLHVSPLQLFSAAPTALFENRHCGALCLEPAWAENIRLLNTFPNGRTGIGFMTRETAPISSAPDVYIGTGDGDRSLGPGGKSNDFRIATNVANVLTDRFTIDGTTGRASFPVGIAGTLNVADEGGNTGSLRIGPNNSNRGAKRVLFGDVAYCYVGEDETKDDVLVLRGDKGVNIDAGTVNPTTISGRLAVGGTSATRGYVEIAASLSTSNPANRYFNSGTSNGFDGAGLSRPTSLYTVGDVVCNELRAFSDQRIKKEIHPTNNSDDLHTLQAIEVSDYQYIDTVAKGTVHQKKVIAQQVEQVYPQAVDKSTDTIPDIYKNAGMKDGWVLLPTDLKPEQRVRLIGEKGETITEVLEVREGAFRPAKLPEGEKLFVYGREVKDFRSVDYDAIAMLNVSATQELARQLNAKDEQIATLETRLAALEKSVATLAALDRPAEPARKETAKVD